MTFGTALPDAVPLVGAHIAAGVAFMQEVRDLVKEQAVMEREHAKCLDNLARRASTRLEKKLRDLSIGATAASRVTESAISSTMSMWSAYLQTMEATAKGRSDLADQMVAQVSDQLKTICTRTEDSRRKHISFAAKLISEQERSLQEKDKAKIKYLQACEDVEAAKLKYERADEKSQEKLKKIWHQQILEMNNAKNGYILSLAVANAHRKSHQNTDIPWVLDEMEVLESIRLKAFKDVMVMHAKLEAAANEKFAAQFTDLGTKVAAIDVQADLDLFIKANISDWHDIADLHFEPTTLWRDTSDLVIDDYCRVVLSNQRVKLLKTRTEHADSLNQLDKKVAGLVKLTNVYTDDPRLGDPTESREEMWEAKRQTVMTQGSIKRSEAVIEAISAVIGEQSHERPHAFKSTGFTLPTTCGYCQNSIWGLSKQGFSCKDCGFACHAKCEMKVPANCPGSKSGTSSEPVSPTTATAPSTTLSINRPESVASTTDTLTSPSSPVRKDPSFTLPAIAQSPSLDMSIDARTIVLPASVQTEGESVLAKSTASGRSTPTAPADTAIKRSPSGSGSKFLNKFLRGGSSRAAGDDASSSSIGSISISAPVPIPSTPAAPAGGANYTAASAPSAPAAPSEVGDVPAPRTEPVDAAAMVPRKAETCAVALYEYQATDGSELDLRKGQIVHLVPDDGGEPNDGWIKVRHGGRQGFVPHNYVQVLGTVGPDTAYAQALFAYQAQNDDEVSVQEGDLMEVLKKDVDGWMEVSINGRTGQIPTSYATVLAMD
ncbi:hypothetical protein AMAG_16220 [Allomyces macrogynus ATCC 38327]|uniref:Uncharacterized protein n=1 Tax=Allomyces macrogynus (strain ATCC 38327) TaxID=578462 RepID=A0A0L0TAD2_ALLM3|nr:hypothetical protein AMAG_16220 [Allomyces macrogynus ATCC 38327]|eukprot:KNE71665.1 hypothetical protein AMAG_16220 [Allomyces macrogynus ATCC 38327]